MHVQNIYKIYLATLLILALTPTYVSAGKKTMPDEIEHNNLLLLEPEKFHQIVPLASHAYGGVKNGKLLDDTTNQYQNWHISAIEGETGLKGANVFKPILRNIKNPFDPSTTLGEIELEELEQSGILALEKDNNSPNHMTAVIVFKGTESASDILTDMNAVKTDLPYGLKGQGHKGFVDTANSSYSSVKQNLLNSLNATTGMMLQTLQDVVSSGVEIDLVIMGHSLGAAKALLTASYLFKEMGLTSAHDQNIRLFVITIGSPRVFDSTAAAEIDGLFGNIIVNLAAYPFDIVTLIPFEAAGYKHVGHYVSVPVIAHARNFESVNNLYKAYYGDQAAVNPMAERTIQDAASLALLDTETNNNQNGFSLIEVAKSLGNFGTNWHSCKNYVSTIIRDNVYQNFYSDSYQIENLESDNHTPPSWSSMAFFAGSLGVQAYKMVRPHALILYMMLINSRQTAPAA